MERLLAACGRLSSAAVGFSAGVDSTVVLWALVRVLGAERVLAVTARSPTFPARELEEARALARHVGVRLHVIESDEMANPEFRNNPGNRCFFCKTELYGKLRSVADLQGLAEIVDGTNRDDEGDWRPGLAAAAQHGVRSPLRDAGLTKADVRAVAREAGLPNAEKPAFACLSSRIPYGEVITVEKLSQVGRSEEALRALGFGQLRVRHHRDVARIEVPASDFARVLELADVVVSALREAGYRHVALDLAGYRPGSLNAALPGPAGAGGGLRDGEARPRVAGEA
ncbi:MAG: ATP-dependent sacrificial sulfur transferase LarE [Gemmatimonadota bacterium]